MHVNHRREHVERISRKEAADINDEKEELRTGEYNEKWLLVVCRVMLTTNSSLSLCCSSSLWNKKQKKILE